VSTKPGQAQLDHDRTSRVWPPAETESNIRFCYTERSGQAGHTGGIDDDACIKTLADIFYRTIYHREAGQP